MMSYYSSILLVIYNVIRCCNSPLLNVGPSLERRFWSIPHLAYMFNLSPYRPFGPILIINFKYFSSLERIPWTPFLLHTTLWYRLTAVFYYRVTKKYYLEVVFVKDFYKWFPLLYLPVDVKIWIEFYKLCEVIFSSLVPVLDTVLQQVLWGTGRKAMSYVIFLN